MKKILKIILGVAVVFFLLIAGFLVLALRSGSGMQEAFFKAVASGDAQMVISQFHPDLAKEVDPPVLETWMHSFKQHLGEFKGLSATDFNTSTSFETVGKITKSSGTVNFEKGQAQSELEYLDSKLTRFKVTSDVLPTNWFTGPSSTSLYQTRAKQFLSDVLAGKLDEAHAQMHEALQKNLPLEQFKAGMPQLISRLGGIKSINYTSEKAHNDESYRLEELFEIEAEKENATASIAFEFPTMRGQILGFEITPVNGAGEEQSKEGSEEEEGEE